MKISPALDDDKKTPKYQQIVNLISHAIRIGDLKKGDQLYSINELSDELLLARDTVQKAYNILRSKGIIKAIRGKGYFIHRTDIASPFKILLLFNKISNYKKQVYDSFVRTMGNNAVIDLKIHHFSTSLLEKFITDDLNDYDYFVIMPHFYEAPDQARRIISMIPPHKLVILDKDINYIQAKYAAVYQDFMRDIKMTLEEALKKLKKYDKLILVQPTIIPYPPEITAGFKQFCHQEKFKFDIIPEITAVATPHRKEAYIIIEETDLVNLIRNCRTMGLKIGKDIGIISCNDTPLKEILLDGITVITTDHAKMGETAAKLILENRKDKIKNPFRLIIRHSL